MPRRDGEEVTEDQFKNAVVDLAHYRRWLVMHTLPALNAKGRWRTPLQGDKGFLDLVLARAGRVVIAELKSEAGRLKAEQKKWIEALSGGSVEVYVWRPSDMNEIQRILR